MKHGPFQFDWDPNNKPEKLWKHKVIVTMLRPGVYGWFTPDGTWNLCDGTTWGQFFTSKPPTHIPAGTWTFYSCLWRVDGENLFHNYTTADVHLASASSGWLWHMGFKSGLIQQVAAPFDAGFSDDNDGEDHGDSCDDYSRPITLNLMHAGEKSQYQIGVENGTSILKVA